VPQPGSCCEARSHAADPAVTSPTDDPPRPDPGTWQAAVRTDASIHAVLGTSLPAAGAPDPVPRFLALRTLRL